MKAAAAPEIHLVVAPDIWIRRKEMTDGFARAYLVLAVLAVALGTLPDPHGHRLVAAAVMAPFLLASLLMAWRYRRAGLMISGDGVIIRGPLRSRSLSLGEVQSFDAEAIGSGMVQSAYGIRVLRTRGRLLTVQGLSRFGWTSKKAREAAKAAWRPTVDALNELLASVKGGAVPAPPPLQATREGARRVTIAFALSNAIVFGFLLILALISRDSTILRILAAIDVPFAIWSTLYIRRSAYRQVGKADAAASSPSA